MHLCFEPPPIYFVHVPKTGGTVLGQWLHSAYGRGYFDLDLPKIMKLTGPGIHSFRCYHSWHHGRSLLEWLQRPQLTVITMLRDPVERAVSLFGYHQRVHAIHPEWFKAEHRDRVSSLSGVDLQECLDDGLIPHFLSNGQSRVLGIRKDYPTFLDRVMQATSEVRSHALLRPYDVPLIVDTDDLPLLAMNAHAWLDEMAVVGLTERYAESLLMIGDLLGIPVPAEPPRVNVSPRRTDPAMRYRDQLASDVVARLEELNRYDLELYTHAQDLFEQQWARYQARPRRTYSIAASVRHRLHPVRERAKQMVKQTPLLAQLYASIRKRA